MLISFKIHVSDCSHATITAHDYTPNSSKQIKFADDVTVLVLISSDDESYI